MTRIAGTINTDLCIYDNISLNSSSNEKCFRLRCVKIEAHILYSITFLSENRVVYEILWENMAQPDRPRMTTVI